MVKLTIYFCAKLQLSLNSGITVLGVHWTGNRLVILTTTCTYLTSFVVTYAFLREIRVQQLPLEGEEEDGTQTGIGVGTATGAGAEARNPDERSDFTNTSQQRAMDQEKGKQLIERDIENTIEMRNFARKVDAASSSSLHHRSSAHTTNVLHSRAELFTIDDDDDDDEDDEKENENEGAENERFSVEALSAADSINFSNNNNNNTTIANQDQNGANLANYEEYKPVQRGLYSIWGELLHSPTFWRFSVLTLFLINLNTIFRHLDATLPTYLVRCFGSNYPKGIIYSINPFIIMWLTPVIAALTSKSAHYDMIKYGGYVSAASPFFLAMATQTWAVVMFVVFLSLGEAVWSPRVYDYTMSIAPEVKYCSFWVALCCVLSLCCVLLVDFH